MHVQLPTINAKIIIVSEQPFAVPGIDEATFNIGKMSEEAGVRLLQRIAPEVSQLHRALHCPDMHVMESRCDAGIVC